MKLKEIPANTVVHTPTEEEAKELLAILHENGYKWCHGKDLSDISIMAGKEAVGINFDGTRKNTIINFWYIETARRKRFTIITLAEFKERYCEEENPLPKFKVGDRVKVVGYQKNCIAMMGTHIGEVGTIIQASGEDGIFYQITCDNDFFSWREDWLEPYTEPKTKPTEDMEAKEKEPGEKGNNSENSQLNLCELLKGHEGEEFYSPYYGAMKLMTMSDGLLCFQNSNIGIDLLANGHSQYAVEGCCAIFPSKAIYEQYPLDAYTAWMKWQEGQKKEYGLGVVLQNMNPKNCEVINGHTLLFHTPADRDKCIEEIQVIIEKYSKQ